jgi:glycosyltransferase involved in cell wall biosynthesis
MKIAQVSPYYPPADGGIAIFTRELADKLSELGNDVKVFAREGPKGFGLGGKKREFINRAINELIKFQPDVIHAHSDWYTMKAALDYKNHHSKKTRIVFTVHTGLAKPLKGLKKYVFDRMLKQCDNITFVSGALREEFFRYQSLLNNTSVIYAGVNQKIPSNEMVSEFKKKYGIHDTDVVITFIGPFEWPRKVEGIKLLIESFAAISKENSHIKLMLVGDGSLRHELEAIVKTHNLESRVIFTGFVKDAFVPLNITTIYAHISLQEGLPLALLEAMSAGVPVIASKTGGIPEVIQNGENGLLVGNDPILLSRAIISLIDNSTLREELAIKGKQTVDENFTWTKTANAFMAIYEG